MQAKWHSRWLSGQDSSKALSKDQGVGGSPIVRMIPPLISIWNHPAHRKLNTPLSPSAMAHTLWSVQFSRSVLSYSLRPHGLQHARLPCLPSTPRTCSNSCPLSQRCHPILSFSVVPSPPARRRNNRVHYHFMVARVLSSYPVTQKQTFDMYIIHHLASGLYVILEQMFL